MIAAIALIGAFVKPSEEAINQALLAANQRRFDVVEGLLPQVESDSINRTLEDRTLLSWALIGHGSERLFREILKKGADPNAGKLSPLTAAAMRGTVLELKILVARGARLRSKTSDASMAINIAARSGRVSNVQCLLDAGADINSQHRGLTPFFEAVWEPNVEVVLLRAGARTDLVDTWGNDIYAEIIHLYTVAMIPNIQDPLLLQTADVLLHSHVPATRRSNGLTPLEFAKSVKWQPMVRLLSEN